MPNLSGLNADAIQNRIIEKQNRESYVRNAMRQNDIFNWYKQKEQSSIGKFTQIRNLIAEGDYAQASALNYSINASLLPEIFQQNMNMMCCNRYLRMSDSSLVGLDSIKRFKYTPQEIVEIIKIAQQCELTGGIAVFEARATLDAELINYSVSKDVCEFNNLASYCCYADSIKLDTIYCLGSDINGNKQYQFTLSVNHKCHSGNEFTLNTTVGSIGSLSTNHLELGNNIIYGVYTCPSSIANFVCSINFQAELNSCTKDSIKIALPTNGCNSIQACDIQFTYLHDGCNGIDEFGNPVYSISLEIVNNYAYDVYDTLETVYGKIENNIIFLSANSTTQTDILFTDTLPYDGYICINAKTISPQNSQPCQSLICLPLKESINCIRTNGCNITETRIDEISCLGVDNNGKRQYKVKILYVNPFAYISPTLHTSISTMYGIINNITPSTPNYSGQIDTVEFVFTNSTDVNELYLNLTLTETANQPYFSCGSDYTINSNLTRELPSCNSLRLINPHSNHKSSSSSSFKSTSIINDNNCAVKVIPNPNNGRPSIYYKYSVDEFNNTSIDNLSLSIIESSSGKLIVNKKLPNLAGIINWWLMEPLPQGHYTIILHQNNKLLCETKMEVIN
jgi:hypothetical protein